MISADRAAENNQTPWSFVREKVDPQNTLPHVVLQRVIQDQEIKGTLVPIDYQIIYNGESIGKAIVRKNTIKRECYFNWINMDESYRGKGGFGLATYVAAIESALQDGYTFKTHDWSQSERAKRIWDILVEKGVANVIEPFITDGTGKYKGCCEVKNCAIIKK